MGKQHKSYCRSWIDIGNTRVFCVLESGHAMPHVSRDWEADTKRRLAERWHMREVRWWYARVPPPEVVVLDTHETLLLEDTEQDDDTD